MSAGIESAPVFRTRAQQIGLNNDQIQLLTDAGLDTLGKFAFCCATQPGTGDETAFVEMLTGLIGAAPTVGALALYRRLFYEANTVAVFEMKGRLDRTEDDAPKKMPNAERAARLERQQGKLMGLVISGPLEPAHSLVDRVHQQLEDNELRFIPLHECPSRDMEILGHKRDDTLKLDTHGNLKIQKLSHIPDADVSSDLKAQQAFTRRALAYDQAGLFSFEVLESWTAQLFRAMSSPPPPGYSPVTLAQVYQADRTLFTKLAEVTRRSIQPILGADKPLDIALKDWRFHPEIAFIILPLPTRAAVAVSTNNENVNKRGFEHTRDTKGRKGTPKGDGKGKGGKSQSSKLPEGCSWKNSKGQPVCPFFNNETGCKYAEAGKRCRRGFHVCWKTSCNKAFPYYRCQH